MAALVGDPQIVPHTPETYDEAMASPERDKWLEAMQREGASLKQNGTWAPAPLPPDRKALKLRWVYAVKRDAGGNIVRFKARLVAKGYAQIHGLDYNETFSPVVRMSTMHIVLVIALERRYEVWQFDVETAYLNGVLQEIIFVSCPRGLDYAEGTSLKLKKAIYGLKQSALVWHNTLAEALKELGMVQLRTDECCFRHYKEDIFLVVYVDDILVTGPSASVVARLMDKLSQRFKLKAMGRVHDILRMRARCDREAGTISMSQSGLVKDILRRSNMENSRPVSVPPDPGSLKEPPSPEEATSPTEYRSLTLAAGYGRDMLMMIEGTSAARRRNIPVRFCAWRCDGAVPG